MQYQLVCVSRETSGVYAAGMNERERKRTISRAIQYWLLPNESAARARHQTNPFAHKILSFTSTLLSTYLELYIRRKTHKTDGHTLEEERYGLSPSLWEEGESKNVSGIRRGWKSRRVEKSAKRGLENLWKCRRTNLWVFSRRDGSSERKNSQSQIFADENWREKRWIKNIYSRKKYTSSSSEL